MLLIFDVLGTLFSFDAVKKRFQALNMPGLLMELWLAKLLRAAMASTLARKYVPFRVLAQSTLKQLLTRHEIDERAAEPLLASLDEVRPWPDAPSCVRALRAREYRLVALTNNGAEETELLLDRWGLRKEFERVFSADMAKCCKPHPAPYEIVLTRMLAGPYDCSMISAHAWDVLGAESMGMNTVYVSRLEKQWIFPGSPAGLIVPSLADVPAAILRQSASSPEQEA